MRLAKSVIAATTAIALSGAANAQGQPLGDTVADVSFFERVVVGEVEITPFGVIEDSRCIEYPLCFEDDELIISAVLWEYGGKREIILREGYFTPVPGGYLLLLNGGAWPKRNGAIPLNRYQLDISYVYDYAPLEEDLPAQDSAPSEPMAEPETPPAPDATVSDPPPGKTIKIETP